MNRRSFFKRMIAGVAAAIGLPLAAKAESTKLVPVMALRGEEIMSFPEEYRWVWHVINSVLGDNAEIRFRTYYAYPMKPSLLYASVRYDGNQMLLRICEPDRHFDINDFSREKELHHIRDLVQFCFYN